MKDSYIFPAVFDIADDGVSVEFPDLPGCLPCGDTVEKAVENAKEALKLHIFGMEQDHEEIPEPSKVNNIECEKNQCLMLIDVFMPSFRENMKNKPVKKTLTLPTWLNDMAVKENINFSAVLREALEAKLNVR